MPKIITILILFGFLLPSFSFSQEPGVAKIPESIGEAKEIGKSFLPMLPGFIQGLWQEVIMVWQAFFKTIKGWWDKYIFPWLDKYLLQKIEKRAPLIQEEFKKEKTEMKGEIKTEVPKAGKTLWQKFKDLLR